MFEYREFLQQLFNENPGKTPEQLWAIANSKLTDSQKIAAFEATTGKPYLQTQLNQWNQAQSIANAKAKAVAQTPVPVAHHKIVSTNQTPVVHVGPVYDPEADLTQIKCTHNPARSEQHVLLADWEEQDWKCLASYYHGKADSYRKTAKYAEGVVEIFHQNESATKTSEIWAKVTSTLGDLATF